MCGNPKVADELSLEHVMKFQSWCKQQILTSMTEGSGDSEFSSDQSEHLSDYFCDCSAQPKPLIFYSLRTKYIYETWYKWMQDIC